MADSTAKDIAEKLLVPGFSRAGPSLAAITDPIADTPMLVTLDQLQPYDLNPRVTRNPCYDEIKSSILVRGLDAPPAITRRPGESCYIVRNGGNTRLSILRELWSETKDERFFRIPCLFRPWSARGEIVALTGHLCENELHGSLSFIERAMGIEKARELYETEAKQALTQTDLAKRLTADGYPITQSHISRMQEAVRYLLPAIPSVLYAGLGKPQIEKLTALRKAGERAWDRHADGKPKSTDFPGLFQDVLILFDDESAEFNVQRVEDELVGQLAGVLGMDYDVLKLEFVDAEARQRALSREPGAHSAAARASVSTSSNLPQSAGHSATTQQSQKAAGQDRTHATTDSPAVTTPTTKQPQSPSKAIGRNDGERKDTAASDEQVQAHIVSTADTTSRLEAVQRTIAQATGEPVRDFKTNVIESIPVQAGGLYPISDVWYIEAGLDMPDRLRVHIVQLAREIAEEAQVAPRIEVVDHGIGFVCTAADGSSRTSLSSLEKPVLALLHALSAGYIQTRNPGIDGSRLGEDLASLLQGELAVRRGARPRLSDVGIVKLFRLIRLARRIVELESPAPSLPASAARR